MEPRVRIYAVAIAAGLIAETAIVLTIDTVGERAYGASILLVVEAIVLGLVFGAGPGMAAAVVPIGVFVAWDLLFSGGGGAELSAALFVAILLGFCAWLPGVLRARYGRAR